MKPEIDKTAGKRLTLQKQAIIDVLHADERMLLGIGFCFTGLWVSYTVRLASGASIVMVAVGAYALVSLVRFGLRRRGGTAREA